MCVSARQWRFNALLEAAVGVAYALSLAPRLPKQMPGHKACAVALFFALVARHTAKLPSSSCQSPPSDTALQWDHAAWQAES